MLVADEAAIVLEGDWAMDKLLIMEFDTGAAAWSLRESPTYQSISDDRRAGAETVAVLVRGL